MSDPTPKIVSFAISKEAIHVGLTELSAFVYPEVHDALRQAVNAVPDPVEIRLAEPFALDFLHSLNVAIYRHTRDERPTACALAEAAGRLEFAINQLRD
jgi:hypothetical protein